MNTQNTKDGPSKSYSITVTAEQAALFEQVAQSLGTDPEKLVTALACDRLRINPVSDDPAYELQSYLWRYCAEGETPKVDREWLELVPTTNQPPPAPPDSALWKPLPIPVWKYESKNLSAPVA